MRFILCEELHWEAHYYYYYIHWQQQYIINYVLITTIKTYMYIKMIVKWRLLWLSTIKCIHIRLPGLSTVHVCTKISLLSAHSTTRHLKTTKLHCALTTTPYGMYVYTSMQLTADFKPAHSLEDICAMFPCNYSSIFYKPSGMPLRSMEWWCWWLTGFRSQWMILSRMSILRHWRRDKAKRRISEMLNPWKLFFLISS